MDIGITILTQCHYDTFFFLPYLLTCAQKYCSLDGILMWEVVAMTKRGHTMTKKKLERCRTRSLLVFFLYNDCCLSVIPLFLSRFSALTILASFSNVCVWIYRNRSDCFFQLNWVKERNKQMTKKKQVHYRKHFASS